MLNRLKQTVDQIISWCINGRVKRTEARQKLLELKNKWIELAEKQEKKSEGSVNWDIVREGEKYITTKLRECK